jgi:hypothetical protein
LRPVEGRQDLIARRDGKLPYNSIETSILFIDQGSGNGTEAPTLLRFFAILPHSKPEFATLEHLKISGVSF